MEPRHPITRPRPLAFEDPADHRRLPIGDLHGRPRPLGHDRRYTVDLPTEVGEVVVDLYLHDHRVILGNLWRHTEDQSRILELDRDGVVRHDLNRDLVALDDLGRHVVQGCHSGM